MLIATSVSLSGGIGFIAGGYDVTLSNLETNLHHAGQLIKSHPEKQNPACKFYAEMGILPLGVGFINWGVDREEALYILRKYKVAAVWLLALMNMPDELVPWVNDLRSLYGDITGFEITAEQVSGLYTTEQITRRLKVQVYEREQRPRLQVPVYIDTIPPTLLAALLGATCGILGTRFLASHKLGIPRGYQAAVIHASDRGVSTVRSTDYDRARGIKGWSGRYDGRGFVNESSLMLCGGWGWRRIGGSMGLR